MAKKYVTFSYPDISWSKTTTLESLAELWWLKDKLPVLAQRVENAHPNWQQSVRIFGVKTVRLRKVAIFGQKRLDPLDHNNSTTPLVRLYREHGQLLSPPQNCWKFQTKIYPQMFCQGFPRLLNYIKISQNPAAKTWWRSNPNPWGHGLHRPHPIPSDRRCTRPKVSGPLPFPSRRALPRSLLSRLGPRGSAKAWWPGIAWSLGKKRCQGKWDLFFAERLGLKKNWALKAAYWLVV